MNVLTRRLEYFKLAGNVQRDLDLLVVRVVDLVALSARAQVTLVVEDGKESATLVVGRNQPVQAVNVYGHHSGDELIKLCLETVKIGAFSASFHCDPYYAVVLRVVPDKDLGHDLDLAPPPIHRL